MLNRLSIEAILPIAQNLDERGLRVLPNDGTPLMNLVQATDFSLVGECLDQGADLIQLVQDRSSSDLHGAVKQDIIDLGAAAVSRLHQTVREKVLPEIKEIVPQVQEQIAARRVSAILPYTINMVEIPAVYSNGALEALANRYPADNTQYASRILYPVDIDTVIELCKTGMEGFDKELATGLSLKNNEGYAQIRKVLIGEMVPSEIDPDYLPGLLVMAAAIYNEPCAGVNLSLSDYNAQVNKLLGVTATMVRAVMMRNAVNDRAGLLYSAKKRESLSVINVMGKTYRKMLDQGLTPEAVIGNEMAGRRFSQGQLIEKKDELEKVYAREMSLRGLRVQAEMVGVTRQILTTIFTRKCNERFGEEAEASINSLKKMVANVSEKNCDDIHQMVTELVCELFYPGTDALVFIATMNHVGRTVAEDTDPREIALMATYKYISRWLVRQLGLVQA